MAGDCRKIVRKSWAKSATPSATDGQREEAHKQHIKIGRSTTFESRTFRGRRPARQNASKKTAGRAIMQQERDNTVNLIDKRPGYEWAKLIRKLRWIGLEEE